MLALKFMPPTHKNDRSLRKSSLMWDIPWLRSCVWWNYVDLLMHLPKIGLLYIMNILRACHSGPCLFGHIDLCPILRGRGCVQVAFHLLCNYMPRELPGMGGVPEKHGLPFPAFCLPFQPPKASHAHSPVLWWQVLGCTTKTPSRIFRFA